MVRIRPLLNDMVTVMSALTMRRFVSKRAADKDNRQTAGSDKAFNQINVHVRETYINARVFQPQRLLFDRRGIEQRPDFVERLRFRA